MEPQTTSVIKDYLHYFVGAIGTMCIAIFTYVVNLGSRVTTLETLQKGQKATDDSMKEYLKDYLDAKFEGLDTRLARIEANGNSHAQSH